MSLSGKWKANDGATYYVRQIGDIIWWSGISSDEGKAFTNVFRATIQGDSITGEWTDVPQGSILGNGTLHLKIIKKTSLRECYICRRYPKQEDLADLFGRRLMNNLDCK
jgi:hypothetical protein